MLEYKFQKNNEKDLYKELDIDSIEYYFGDTNVRFNTKSPHNLRNGDNVRLTKSTRSYEIQDTRQANFVGKKSFAIDSFEPYPLQYTSTEFGNYQTGFLDESGTPFYISALTINFEIPHTLFDETEYDMLNAYIPFGYFSDEVTYDTDIIPRACKGDYVGFNGLVYEVPVDGITEDGKYKLNWNNPYSEICKNKKDVVISYQDESGNTHTIDNGFVPVLVDGDQNLYKLVFFLKGGDERTNELQYINEHSDTLTLLVKDDRFIGDTSEELSKKVNKRYSPSGMTNNMQYYYEELSDKLLYGDTINILTNNAFIIYDGKIIIEKTFTATANDVSVSLGVLEKAMGGQDEITINYTRTSYHLKDTVTVEKECGFYTLDLPFIQENRSDLFNEYNYTENLLKRMMEESVNPIIDYEKMIFEPAWYGGEDLDNIDESKLLPVEEIEFNLHFRNRTDTENDFWEPSDTEMYYNYMMTSGVTGLILIPYDDIKDTTANFKIGENAEEPFNYDYIKDLKDGEIITANENTIFLYNIKLFSNIGGKVYSADSATTLTVSDGDIVVAAIPTGLTSALTYTREYGDENGYKFIT